MLATFLVTFENSNLAVVQFKGSFWVQFRGFSLKIEHLLHSHKNLPVPVRKN